MSAQSFLKRAGIIVSIKIEKTHAFSHLTKNQPYPTNIKNYYDHYLGDRIITDFKSNYSIGQATVYFEDGSFDIWEIKDGDRWRLKSVNESKNK